MKPNIHLILFQERKPPNTWEMVEAGQGLALLRCQKFHAAGHLVRTKRQREELAHSLRSEAPRLVVLLVGSGQVKPAMAFADAMEGLPKNSHVLVGGVFGTLCCHEFTPKERVQAILLGEWQEALAEYAESFLKQGFAVDVNGTLVRGLRGWSLNDQRKYRPALDEWPDPEMEDFRLEDLLHLNGGAMPIHASRGFPFQTLFSPQPSLRDLQKTEFHYYMRPPERVAAEAEALCKKYKIRAFDFVDDVFPWTGEWTQQFVNEWKKRVPTPFRIKSPAEYLVEDRLTALREAGLRRVVMEVDAGDEELRQRHSSLNQTNERIEEAIRMLRNDRVENHLRLLLAVPGESYRTLRETVKLAQSADADRTTPELYVDWPDSHYWADTERALTGQNAPRPKGPIPSSIAQDAEVARHEIVAADSLHRSKRIARTEAAKLDGLADFPKAVARSPLEGPARIDRFYTSNHRHDVIALRVPADLSFEVEFPRDATLNFGILLRPEFPGERSRLPISFSIRAKQEDRTYRIFQKILIQALDPDSRRWHWFRVPVSGVQRGPGVLVLENLVFGNDASFIPPDQEIWAGWGRVVLQSKGDAQASLEEEEMPHAFDDTDMS